MQTGINNKPLQKQQPKAVNQKRQDPKEVTDSTIAAEFLRKYYNCFDNEQDKMMSFHSAKSKLTFDGEFMTGNDRLFAKFTTLGKVSHIINDVDAQEACSNKAKKTKGLVVLVTGDIKYDGGRQKFTEVFHLHEGGAHGWLIKNNMFRFRYKAARPK